MVNGKIVTPEKNGYVIVQDENEYNVSLTNNYKSRRCDAEIKIDDITMGLFRIPANDTVTIERSSKTNNHFKFVIESSTIVDDIYGSNAEKKRESSHNGVVSVIFKPEYEQPQQVLQTARILNTYPKPSNSFGKNYNYEEEEEVDMGCGMDMFGSDDNKEEVYMGGDNGHAFYTLKKSMTKTQNVKAGMTVLSDKLSKQTFTTVCELDYDLSKITTINLRLVATENKHASLESIHNSTPIPDKP
jgi:hypothetical protein